MHRSFKLYVIGPASACIVLAWAALPVLAETDAEALNSDVLEYALRYPEGGGYRWTAGNTGVPRTLTHQGEPILAEGEGVICCGYTLAVAWDAAERRGLFREKSIEQLRAFQKHWYGSVESNREELCVQAVELLGIGKEVPLEEARPGDFVQFWRTSGSGHSVVLLEAIREDGRVVALHYRSAQKSTDGIGDRTEYFADVDRADGQIDRERTYVCRLHSGSESLGVDDRAQLEQLLARGDYATAETRLRARLADPDGPAVSESAIELERLRRIRHDFSLTTAEVLEQLQEEVPSATLADLTRWRDAGDLQYRVIDGQPRYFNRAVSNLFRFNAEAQRRRRPETSEKRFDLTAHIEELTQQAETDEADEVYPMEHTVRFALAVDDDHPAVRPGAIVRAWLPYPQEYRQQRDVELLHSDPPYVSVAENGTPHRTVYFEFAIAEPAESPRIELQYRWTTSAWVPRLDPERVAPYDAASDVYQQYTAERLPHIPLSEEVRALAAEIVGDATNPLIRARKIFHWVSSEIPWCAEMEYGIIDSLAAKGLAARRGDCGVQGMVFITLCRAAGIPARWQSGWQLQPGRRNMHDWSEFYVEPWGWLPADASYGTREHSDPRVRDFLCGNIDPYRLIVNLDYARPLSPQKTSLRSEPNDFQRGEIEIDGRNLYFDQWSWEFEVESKRIDR